MPRERTEAQRRAEARYKDSHYDRIAVNVIKGTRDVWKSEAERLGLSLRRLIVCGVEEYIKNHEHGEE